MFALAALLALAAVSLSTQDAAAATAEQASAAAHEDGWPKVLSADDAQLYRRIFAMQRQARWKDADNLIKRLDDPILLGHVMEQRYMHPWAYRSKYRELKDWLAAYRDHPQAGQVYKLALKRRPKGAAAPAKPVRAYRPGPRFSESVWDRRIDYKSPRKRSAKTRKYVDLINAMIRKAVRRGDTARAEELVRHPDFVRLFDTIEQDIARTRVATLMLVKGEAGKAFKLAGPAADRSAAVVPQAHWIAGLGAWRMKDYSAARHHFALYAEGKGLSEWSRAAGAFWAGRANMAVNRYDEAERWWAKAARYPLSFYGRLARHLLGEGSAQTWVPAAPAADTAESDVFGQPALRRALALNQVGEHERAAKELERLVDGAGPALAATLAPLAEHVNAPDVALKAGRRLVAENGLGYAAAIYPVPGWTPKGGYTVDRALLFALIRQESHFNPRAVSRSGARGLMQLMPATARFVARTAGLDANRKTLYRPEANMSLGQAYLRHLMDNDAIGDNLLFLMAAYNAGPGSLQKWLRRHDYNDDALYFIETLPARETRHYIERVMSNLWSYRSRLHQPAPSLDDLAEGRWPRYVRVDDQDGVAATAAAR